MPPLSNAAGAIIEIRKIEDYCLSPTHPRGRHKARVFRVTLGLEQSDASWLRQALLDGLLQGEPFELTRDTFGARFRVDVALARQGKHAMVRSIWMVRNGEQVPRFVTCWVL